MDRHARTRLLLGKEKMKLLHDSFVVVVGVGAVGGFAIEGLVRAGVGRLRLVDFDVVKASNLNRQLLALDSTIGKAKVDCAAARIRDINPACRVEVVNCFAADETFDALLAGTPSLVIDAIDSVNPKVQLLRTAYERKIPIISSMGAAMRTDPSVIRCGDLFSSKHCRLARFVRRRLRRLGITHGIKAVYSEQIHSRRTAAIEQEVDADEYDRGRKRKAIGSLPTIPGIFGLTIAHYAIEHLIGGFES